MTKKVGIHCLVSGRVQGVWFRASTQNFAKEHQISGCATNLADGRVEVIAFGEEDKIALLREWLQSGPPLAQVSQVIAEEIPWEERSSFDVK